MSVSPLNLFSSEQVSLLFAPGCGFFPKDLHSSYGIDKQLCGVALFAWVCFLRNNYDQKICYSFSPTESVESIMFMDDETRTPPNVLSHLRTHESQPPSILIPVNYHSCHWMLILANTTTLTATILESIENTKNSRDDVTMKLCSFLSIAMGLNST